MTLWLYAATHPIRRLVSMRPIIPFAARRAAAIITVSRSAKADIVRLLGVPPEKVHVIYEAPGPAFRPLTGSQEGAGQNQSELAATRSTYNLPQQYILHVGTLEPRKNLVRLMEAFARLRRGGTIPHHLVLVGQPGWKWGQILAAVDRLALSKVVHFLGYVPDQRLPAIFNLAEALVYPSLYEGFGLPVIEAMACGLPVITTARGALPEVAGEAAVMVDPLDADDIAQGIQRVIDDRSFHRALRARGLERARRFSWSKTAEQTRQVYWQVATGEVAAGREAMVRRPSRPFPN
jgi:glycosyltransferase involved in cell wall biosynthesis